ncbi:MAG: hypothetical protein AAGG59_05640 [Bacteroidota bacterium]
MEVTTEVNQGEIRITFHTPVSGKISLQQLGVTNDNLALENGLLRLVFDLDSFRDCKYYKVPTLEFHYMNETRETHWQCDYNDYTILDKLDHHGKSTVLLLKRDEISMFENKRDNRLIVHAEFMEPVKILANQSFIHLYK